jgi:hypothetical protein
MIWIQLLDDKSKPGLLISSTYRPPNANYEYLNKVVDCIEKVSAEEQHFIILGDLNIDYKIDETLANNPIYLLEHLFSLKQLIESPTRVTASSSKVIDVILTSNPLVHKKSGVYETSISDHYLIYTSIETKVSSNEHKTIKFRNYSKFCEEKCLTDFKRKYDELTNELKCLDISKINARNIIDEYWFYWKTTFLDLSNKHIPFRIARMKNRNNPWITPDIVKLIYKRNYLYKCFTKKHLHDKTSNAWAEFKKVRKEINREVKRTKKEYYDTMCKNIERIRKSCGKLSEGLYLMNRIMLILILLQMCLMSILPQ